MCTTQDLSFSATVNTTDICPSLPIPTESGPATLQDTSSGVSAAGSFSSTVQKLETSIPVINSAVAYCPDPCEPLSPEEDIEFVNRNKARNRRRLQERWSCQVQGHTYCFFTLDGVHIPLNEEAIETWVSSLYDCTATLLVPPKCIIQPTRPPAQSDAASVITTRSNRTIQYQRPFRYGNLSLTDLRSMRIRLRDSVSSTSVSWNSIASSGVPGIGYLSGKAIKWVGMQILNAFVPLEICRRRWVIRRLVRRMDVIPIGDCAAWLVRKERKISRAIENLLELSSANYKTDYQAMAIKQGALMKEIIERSMFELSLAEMASLSSMSVKVLPLYMLADDASAAENFAGDLRETLLQDAAPTDEELLVAEMATLLCIELAYGPSSPWRDEGYATLWYLYQTSFGKQHLQYLATCGMLMDDLAERAFSTSLDFMCSGISAGQPYIFEKIAVVHFFAGYANDFPRFRHYISGSTGIPVLVQAIESVEDKPFGLRDTVWYVCETLADLSTLDWCIPTFACLGVCPTFVKLLIVNQHATRSRSWITYCIIHILRNIYVCSIGAGGEAVRDAVTDELRQMLPNVGRSVGMELGDAAARRVETWISELGV